MGLLQKIKGNFPKDLPTRLFLGLMVLFALVGAYFIFRISRQVVSTNQTFSLPGDPIVADEQGQDTLPGGTPAPTDIPAANLPTPEPWDGVTRVNVLVMGLDYRDWEAGDVPRTDTMMLLTLDPVNNTAGMLSIPRDLWVTIPGFDYGKINTAYYLGETYNLPGGGAALATRTVEELLGVPIEYYAQIDFQAFVDFIDHIGGVIFTFDEPITLDRRGKANTVTLEPDTYALPGEYALAYVRTRSSEGGDFDRAARQQQMVMAIRDRILEFNQMPELVAKAPQIYQDLSAGINTNMGLNQAIRLAWSALEVDPDKISQVIISNEYVTLEKSPDGLDILRPIPDKIRLLRDEVFGDGAALGPVAEGDILDLVAEEAARVSVRNASSQSGLAASTADWLRDQGFNIVEETNADYSVYSQIYINNFSNYPYALRWLADTLGIPSANIYLNGQESLDYDLMLILGDDWAGNNDLP